jgi:hypothetical protein
MLVQLGDKASPMVARSTKYPHCSFDMRRLSAQFASTFFGEGVGSADFLPADLASTQGIDTQMIKTPYYLIDKQKLLGNL